MVIQIFILKYSYGSFCFAILRRRKWKKKNIKFTRYGNFRYKNQEHTTEVKLSDGKVSNEQISLIEDEFHKTYEHEYTYRLDMAV